MSQLTVSKKKLFIAYAPEDAIYREQLEKHLANQQISIWHKGVIQAGKAKNELLKTQIEEAELVILLISADFLTDDELYDQELMHIIEKHEAGEIQLIPIILRYCNWEASPFAKVQTLPKDGQPVLRSESSIDQDREFTQIAQEIQRIITGTGTVIADPPSVPVVSPVAGKGSNRRGCSVNVAITLSIILALLLLYYLNATRDSDINEDPPITIPTPFPEDSNPKPPFEKDTLLLDTNKHKPSDTVIISTDK